MPPPALRACFFGAAARTGLVVFAAAGLEVELRLVVMVGGSGCNEARAMRGPAMGIQSPCDAVAHAAGMSGVGSAFAATA